MRLKAGDVVVLKSGGQAMTVAEATDETVECIWLGEEGDLFREKLPASVLEVAHIDMSDDEDEHDEDEDSEEKSEDHHAKKTAEVA
ncbi:uncharacterized protein YodC (DUF2158 family) [Afipia massiliensis]|uniref:Uncharacterized protein YodC (DUF2158 family) n=1 Tax=Afipia massiliensis TaxID=211460 RepID=A0A840N7T5_9BRAD|nr:DUF2158 domain-containing protein [Afipia massiliensis]MBB5053811.1 uncharacterized protein YodC (DUF2158 family) [Afipia massiliensis]